MTSTVMNGRGLFVERTSRVQENRALAVQKLSEANSDDEHALLEKVRIIKEIDGMDIAHITNLLQMVEALKVQEQTTVKQPEPLSEKPL